MQLLDRSVHDKLKEMKLIFKGNHKIIEITAFTLQAPTQGRIELTNGSIEFSFRKDDCHKNYEGNLFA